MAALRFPPTSGASQAPLGFTNGQLEAIKWVAVAFMFLDHFGRHLLGYAQDTWVFAASRISLPLFALVLAVNLARDGDHAARAARTAGRLAVWCAVAQLPAVWARGEPMLVNVLGTLGLGAMVCWAIASPRPLPLRLLAGMAAAAGSWRVEFGTAGVFLIPAIYLWCTQRLPAAAAGAGLMLAVTAGMNASYGGSPAMAGTLASLPIAWGMRQLPFSVPRARLGFYLVYPLHLALIGALNALRA